MSKPVFNYTSKCCEAPAKKPPCEHAKEDRINNEFSQSPLGTWNCTRCGNACSVTRSKVKP